MKAFTSWSLESLKSLSLVQTCTLCQEPPVAGILDMHLLQVESSLCNDHWFAKASLRTFRLSQARQTSNGLQPNSGLQPATMSIAGRDIDDFVKDNKLDERVGRIMQNMHPLDVSLHPHMRGH